ncbi:peroxidase-like [Limulus polyphemus]|uniref:Peroxidase-like n=1 Tax=Limulus polyphemus TaxID=6850 RepID=A0ABM1B672_LIMPO|nr:peroxidase-like [Limulus polyphemus]XP_022242923.1 peroxidase-like [Limulus polyphemus]
MKITLSNLFVALLLISAFSVQEGKKRTKRQGYSPRCQLDDANPFRLQSGRGFSRCRTTNLQRIRLHVKPTYGGKYDAPLIFPGRYRPTEAKQCITSKGIHGICKHRSSCVFAFENVDDLRKSTCRQDNNDIGTCCPVQTFAVIQPIPIRVPTLVIPIRDSRQQATINELNIAGEAGLLALLDLQALELQLRTLGIIVETGTSTAYHQAFFGTKAFTQKVGDNGFVGLKATEELAKNLRLNPTQSRNSLPQFSLKDTIASSVCPRIPLCQSTKYRTIDGSCNNLQNPTWGQSFTSFIRLLQSNYADGLNLPRIASDGGPLPSARDISVQATPDANVPHEAYTLLVMQFAQFLDHDLSLVGLTRGNNGSGIVCCTENVLRNPRLRHPACFEIAISKNDPFYSWFGETCMEFVRSLPAPRPGCSFGPREQLNQITAFIDASNVYGSTEEEMVELRSFSYGQLRVTRIGNTDLLPLELDENVECQTSQGNEDFFCFKAGDERANEQIDLAVLHTIWMREHNRIARILAYNTNWNDEVLYQEARRIVGAQMQHIVFNEFLPLLLGRKVIAAFDLSLTQSGYSNNYNPSVNPSISNSFSAAAYRYGHTLVQGTLDLLERNNEIVDKVPLSTAFFNPSHLYTQGSLDHLLRGLVRQPSQRFDSFVTDQLTNHLFQPPGQKFGMDLVALNIQRGRDHGLPGYNAWRELCGLPVAQTFEDLAQWMRPETVNAFKKLYRNVDDIDLFPAGIAEYPLPGATLGPTFACITADQFRRLKLGDRFWYENGGLESSFSEDQLAEIRKTSLARIICDNSDSFYRMQPLAFLQPNIYWNPLVPCNSTLIPRLDLTLWFNEPVGF